jgi:hypothetical protein
LFYYLTSKPSLISRFLLYEIIKLISRKYSLSPKLVAGQRAIIPAKDR